MADELLIVLETTGKIDVIAKVIDGAGQIGGNIALSEIGTTAVYSADAPVLIAGVFTIKYEDTSGLLGSSELQWDGTQELNFTNIVVNVNVPSETINAATGIPILQADVDGTNQIDSVIRFLFDEQQTPILYLLKDYLDSIDRLISDITEVLFVIKQNATDSDLAALYSVTLADNEVTIDLSNSSISVLITDYSNLVIEDRYFVGIGIKFALDTQFREVPASKRQIEFRQDLIRA